MHERKVAYVVKQKLQLNMCIKSLAENHNRALHIIINANFSVKKTSFSQMVSVCQHRRYEDSPMKIFNNSLFGHCGAYYRDNLLLVKIISEKQQCYKSLGVINYHCV